MDAKFQPRLGSRESHEDLKTPLEAKRDKIEKDVQAVQAANKGVCALVRLACAVLPEYAFG